MSELILDRGQGPLSTNGNPFRGKKPVYIAARFWYDQLWKAAVNLRKWEGLPPSCNKVYLNWQLMLRGFAIGLNDDEGLPRLLDGTFSGLNPYGFPTHVTAVNHALGTMKRISDVDGFLIMSNTMCRPATEIVKEFAWKMAQVDNSIAANLMNTNFAKLFRAGDAASANKIRQLVDDVTSGKPAVIVDDNLSDQLFGSSNKLPVYSIPGEYIADRLIQNRIDIYNQYLNQFGIKTSGANMVKAERNTVAEVKSNDEGVYINECEWLDTLRWSINKLNAFWGTKITVELNRPAMPMEGGADNGVDDGPRMV